MKQGFKKILKLVDGKYCSIISFLKYQNNMVFWEIGKITFPNDELKAKFNYANGLYMFPSLEVFQKDYLFGTNKRILSGLKNANCNIDGMKSCVLTCEYDDSDILKNHLNCPADAIVLAKCLVLDIQEEQNFYFVFLDY